MRIGLLVVSHGSKDSSWVTLVDEAIAGARWPEGLPVASSFLEGVPDRSIQDGIDQLEALGVDHIGVVPLFVSSGSTHVDEIAYALGAKSEPLCETDLEPFHTKAHILYGQPIDDDDAMIAMVSDRLQSLGVVAQRDAVLLVAHGSPHMPFQTWWREGLERIAARLVEDEKCISASHALLCCDSLPDAVQQSLSSLDAAKQSERDMQSKQDQQQDSHEKMLERVDSAVVAVVPIFLSKGYFTTKAIPERLQLEPHSIRVGASADKGAILPHSLVTEWEGRILYDGEPLLPHPALSIWLEQESQRVLSRIEESLSNG
ncbi:sirohydrochlorin chelatase [Paenibacillus assamensis]|uniref:sirohydrochlorin chelatase n=1 Tax=Paenibacillus assamensis TaxID=311244 RepID=UPI000404287E|nr:CbiX/SirB N-terminal domain-containing protein [Paenibacillus assamensis]